MIFKNYEETLFLDFDSQVKIDLRVDNYSHLGA